MSAGVTVDATTPTEPPAPDPYVASARRLVVQAIEASKGFPADARLESATAHLLAGLADLIRFQNNIGGAP